jgi:hypothetical protein
MSLGDKLFLRHFNFDSSIADIVSEDSCFGRGTDIVVFGKEIKRFVLSDKFNKPFGYAFSSACQICFIPIAFKDIGTTKTSITLSCRHCQDLKIFNAPPNMVPIHPKKFDRSSPECWFVETVDYGDRTYFTFNPVNQ